MVDLFRELAEPSRRGILQELKHGPRNVSEIVAATGLKQPNVSNHLSKLRARGIVVARKVGREVYYSLASPEIESHVRSLVESAKREGTPNVPLDELARTYAKAACAGDEQGCTNIVDSLIRQQVPLVRIYQQLLHEAMGYVGRWYMAEAIDVGQEHLATAITERMMGRVLHYAGPVSRNARRAVLGCAPDNWHSIGLRMVSDYLRLCGWRTYYLGQNVPIPSFLSAIREHTPDIVLISSASSQSMEPTLDLVEEIVGLRFKLGALYLIGVGGSAVDVHAQDCIDAGADFTAANLMVFAEEVMPRIEQKQSSRFGVFSNHKKTE